MSTAPTRTRSLRKTAAETSKFERYEAPPSRERSNVSPSRLPKVPSSTTASTRPSRSTNVPRPVTSTGASNSNVPTRSNTNRTGVSRPPLTSENKTLSFRSGARTPTEPNTSLQRANSTRHSRNSSTSALPSRPPSSGGSSNNQTRTAIFPPSASTLIRPPSSASVSSQSTTHQEHNKPNISSRPAFSTLQQHFSPQRTLAPKPPTASFLVPPSPSKLPSNIALSTELAHLQAELLALHQLHKAAAPTYAAYRESAKRALQRRWQEQVVRDRELRELERVQDERAVAACLRAWASVDMGSSARRAGPAVSMGWGLDEKVQVLDQVLTGAWKLSEPSGRYIRLVKRFELWLDSVADILEARKEGRLGSDGSVLFVQELDTKWKDELQMLMRKLGGWREQLKDLGELEGMNRLALVVRGVESLVNGMVEEVKVMERVGREVVEREESWVREEIEGDYDDGSDGGVFGAAWRTW